MPSTVLTPPTVPSTTTAPARNPGAEGVNVTDSVQVPCSASVAVPHVDAPVPEAKSIPVSPCVTTSTLLAVPAVVAVTVTVWATVEEPTGSGPKTWACAPVAASSNAPSPAIQLRLRPRAPALRGWNIPDTA